MFLTTRGKYCPDYFTYTSVSSSAQGEFFNFPTTHYWTHQLNKNLVLNFKLVSWNRKNTVTPALGFVNSPLCTKIPPPPKKKRLNVIELCSSWVFLCFLCWFGNNMVHLFLKCCWVDVFFLLFLITSQTLMIPAELRGCKLGPWYSISDCPHCPVLSLWPGWEISQIFSFLFNFIRLLL